MKDVEFYEENGVITVIKGDMVYFFDSNDKDDVKDFKKIFNL